jgi:hypothetical protein
MECSEDYYEQIEVSVDPDFHDVQECILGAVYEEILPHQSQCPPELDAFFPSPCPVAKFDLEQSEISGWIEKKELTVCLPSGFVLSGGWNCF